VNLVFTRADLREPILRLASHGTEPQLAALNPVVASCRGDRMRETPTDLELLQQLLDDSIARASSV
jgi:hypothetical protein